MKTKLTVDQIIRTWQKHNLINDDHIGSVPLLMVEFKNYTDQSTYIEIAVQHLGLLKIRNNDFFEKCGYEWSTDPKLYRLAAEVDFQVRLIELLSSFWNTQNESQRMTFNYEEIVVREPVISRIAGNTPRVIEINGIAFILVPLGWLDFMHFALFGARQLFVGNKQLALAAVLESFARMLADQVIYEFMSSNYSFDLPDVHPAILTLIRKDIAKEIKLSVAEFNGALGDVPDDGLPDIWADLAYMTLNFVLSHETAHVIYKEHRKGTLTVNEYRADRLGFEIFENSRIWENRLFSDLELSVPGFSVLASNAFIFSSLAQLEAESILIGNTNHLIAFQSRARQLNVIAASKDLIPDDNGILKAIQGAFTVYREFSAKIISELFPVIAIAKKAANRKLEQLIAP